MSDVFHAGGAVCAVRAASKSKRVYLADRRIWWTGYEDGWAGRPVASVEPRCRDGYKEGACAAARRADALLAKMSAERARFADEREGGGDASQVRER